MRIRTIVWNNKNLSKIYNYKKVIVHFCKWYEIWIKINKFFFQKMIEYFEIKEDLEVEMMTKVNEEWKSKIVY